MPSKKHTSSIPPVPHPTREDAARDYRIERQREREAEKETEQYDGQGKGGNG
jgi:hypothetical protein